MPEAAETAAPATPGAQPGTFVDPFRAYNFKLQIQGVTEGHFTECSGLEVEVHPIRYREGGAGQVVHVIPGPVSYGDVTLSYGLRSEEHTSELQSLRHLVCRLLLEKKNLE